MKKNKYITLIILGTLVIFITFFTGCGSDNWLEQETTQKTIVETTKTVIQETTQGSLTGWRAAYKIVISDTLAQCEKKYPNEINYGGYGLYDFDNDDIPELFLEVYSSTMPDYYIRIYDFNGEAAVYLGGIESAHSWVYGTNRDNAFLTESCWMGESAWSIYELKNGEFISEKLASYYPDGFSEDIEPQENPLQDMGYEIEEIEYYFLNDLSGMGIS